MSTKDFSSAQERAVSKFLGWNVVPASGGARFSTGDVVSDKFLGECKTHENAGSKVTFRQDVWRKICDESMVMSRNPVLICDDGSRSTRRTYCLVRSPADLSFLPTSDFSVRKYDVSFKKHLNFDADRLYSKFKRCEGAVYKVHWVEDVLLMSLETFNEYQRYV